ncbi:MAG TPA: cyclopropane-fatty-acyl-phospholipid synthase family protein [Planctomycetota bacterium]
MKSTLTRSVDRALPPDGSPARTDGPRAPLDGPRSLPLELAERGWLPDSLLRLGIRRLLAQRLRAERGRHADRRACLAAWAAQMRGAPIALVPEKANEQHYELPPEFFRLVLGPRLKYSSAHYSDPSRTLQQAEDEMLALTALRADLDDGQEILELGCGWGSLSLWMAEHFPRSRVLAVSNSAPQREFVLARARERGLANLAVVTCDMNTFEAGRRFDRIVSVEMFEHMRNWEALLGRVATWLRPDGRLFLHVFAHRHFAYPFEVRDASDWMGAHFFSGGMMPSADLVEHLATPFRLEERWLVPGTHYARTSEDWLANLVRHRDEVLTILERVHGAEARRWYQRWRLFFLACAELFAHAGGSEWLVVHQRLRLGEPG